MPMPGAPTMSRGSQASANPAQSGSANTNQNGQNPNTAVIPFTRASRPKSRLGGNVTSFTLSAATQAANPVQIPAAGYIRRIRLNVTAVSAGNSAAVAFQPDAPYNILQNVSVLAANGDTLISSLDGFALAMANKYLAFNTTAPFNDPRCDPGFTAITGTGATGGSFSFNIDVPFEIDERDAFCALANMAANQSYLLQYTINNLVAVYSTAPTVAPTVTVTPVMEYWSAPDATTQGGVPQEIAPPGNGSVHILQVQTPPIVAGTSQNIQLANVGNVQRATLFILRTSAGVRTEADWPNIAQLEVNNDPWLYKTKANWRRDMTQRYGQNGTIATSVTAGAAYSGDAGVYAISDWICQGAQGDELVSGSCNRNLWLVTGSGTALNLNVISGWGGAAGNLQVITSSVRPASPEGLYDAFFI